METMSKEQVVFLLNKIAQQTGVHIMPGWQQDKAEMKFALTLVVDDLAIDAQGLWVARLLSIIKGKLRDGAEQLSEYLAKETEAN